jgi:hypothetical protein
MSRAARGDGLVVWGALLAVCGIAMMMVWDTGSGAEPVSSKPIQVDNASQGPNGTTAERLSALSDLNVDQLRRLSAPRWGRDPFALPLKEEAMAGILNLTAIFYRSDSALAIVNRQVVRSGDDIDGRRVISIGRDYMIIQEGKTTRRLDVPKLTTERTPR